MKVSEFFALPPEDRERLMWDLADAANARQRALLSRDVEHALEHAIDKEVKGG